MFGVEFVAYNGGATNPEVRTDSDGTKHFEMILNLQPVPPSIKDSNPMQVFAHELRHVWQAWVGKLKQRNGVDFWEGRPYPDGSIAYRNKPWEIDARDFAARHYSLVKGMEPAQK